MPSHAAASRTVASPVPALWWHPVPKGAADPWNPRAGWDAERWRGRRHVDDLSDVLSETWKTKADPALISPNKGPSVGRGGAGGGYRQIFYIKCAPGGIWISLGSHASPSPARGVCGGRGSADTRWPAPDAAATAGPSVRCGRG